MKNLEGDLVNLESLHTIYVDSHKNGCHIKGIGHFRKGVVILANCETKQSAKAFINKINKSLNK